MQRYCPAPDCSWPNSECFGTPTSNQSATQIQNGINVDHVVFHLIIDAEWESLRRHPMESKVGLDEHQQKELESQDRKELSRESNRQLRLRTILELGNVSRHRSD